LIGGCEFHSFCVAVKIFKSPFNESTLAGLGILSTKYM
jgi:hypothetical protein